MRTIPFQAVDIVKRFEGLMDGNPETVYLDPYLCPAGVWTAGWGHAIRYKGKLLRGMEYRDIAFALYPGGLSKPQCEDLLRADLLDVARDVLSVVQVALNDNQFAALLSFAFNLGVGNLTASTLLRKLNAGDYAGAASEFLRWNKSRGQVLDGLTRRREAEKALFMNTRI